MMEIADKDIVRELLATADPDAVLLYRQGSCVVVPAGEAGSGSAAIIARRRDIAAEGAQMTDDQLGKLARILDNTARDLGG